MPDGLGLAPRSWVPTPGSWLPAASPGVGENESRERQGLGLALPPMNQQTNPEHLVLNFTEDVSAEPALCQPRWVGAAMEDAHVGGEVWCRSTG